MAESVSAAYARGLLELAESNGAGRTALLKESGIEAPVLSDPDARVPLSQYAALMRAAVAATGEPALALHYGESTDIAQLSVVGLIGQAAETMADAHAQLNRYVRLVVDVDTDGPERFRFDADRHGLWLVDMRRRPNAFPELTESAFAQIVCRPRQLGVPGFARAVHVTHPEPAYVDEYTRIFQAPLVFNAARNAILVDGAVLAQRLERLPRYAFGVLTEHADTLLHALERSASTRSEVEKLLMSVLHMGAVSMADIAARLNVSRQTLYRRLKAEGVTFEQVLDELRHRLAMEYLASGKVSVNETAYLVGFSEPAAFSRAFKRWTGMSPRDVRPR
ncbi:MAG: AraC family transcriptional regulator ligand-binding domain-containing protein [Gammaproteobacteria bacterium]|nr:AraC family transcriptional regulator ligand-binding domain-containing protein [Gammaproteobacteria bacterium]